MKKYLTITVVFFVNFSFTNISQLKKDILTFYNKQDYVNSIQKSYELIDLCKKQNNIEELGFAYENVGIFYSDICDYSNSMLFYKKALELLNPNRDKLKYFSIILNIGTTLLEANNNKEAIFYFNKAKKYFENERNKNYPRIICCYTNLAIAYQNINQLTRALENNQKAIYFAKNHYLLDKYPAPLINMGDIYSEFGDFHNAIKNYKEAIFYMSNNNDNIGLWHAKMGLANVNAQQNNILVAKETYNNALYFFLRINDLKNIASCYNKLSFFALQLKDYKEAFKFKNKELIYIDSLRNEQNVEAVSNVKVQIEIANKNKELIIKNQKILNEKKISHLLYFSILLLIIILLILILTYKNRQKLHNQINKEREKNVKIEKEILTKKLLHSEKELETFALHIIQKNELIEEIKVEIKNLKKSNQTEIFNLTSKLFSKLNNIHKRNKEFNLFLKRVEQVNYNFYRILTEKFPNLTLKEQKLCALLKLNLSSKEIALLSNVTIGAVTMARYRLRTKLNIEKDENLIEFLLNLS